MSNKNKMIVRIYGHPYRIGSDSADPGYIQEAAAFLDERMRRVASASRRKVPLEIAILAALEIADEIAAARSLRDRLLSDADEKISRFTRRLEDSSSLGGLLGDRLIQPRRF